MTNEEANYKYDRAIDLIRRIKTEETHEREIDRHKAFDLAINALEKQTPKKPIKTIHKYRQENTTKLGVFSLTHCPICFENKEFGYFESLVDKGTKYCHRCGQALDFSERSDNDEN